MTRYVLANVEVPIKVSDDGSIETLQSFAKIHIIKQISSPEEIISHPLPVHIQITELFQKEEQDNQIKEEKKESMVILKQEIKEKTRKSLRNTSLKHH